jgi:hypothetical protein
MKDVIFVVGDDKSLSEHTKRLTELVIRKSPGVEVQERIFKEYQAEMTGIPTHEGEKVIFIGTKALTEHVKHFCRYKRFGCLICCSRGACVISAQPDLLPYSDYEEFVKYCKGLRLDHEDVVIPPENPALEVIEHAKNIIGLDDNQSVHQAQYSTLIHEFMDNYFDKFIHTV